jgi:hypothetical protein
MQWFTGWVAAMAQARGLDPYVAALATIGLLMVAGTIAFVMLPAPVDGSNRPPSGAG